MNYYAYILQSEKDNRYYYGSTGNLAERLKQHNLGKVPSTKHRRPLRLVYQESFAEKRDAIQRERFFKTIAGYLWLKTEGII